MAFCFTCIKAINTGKMKLSGNMKDSSLIFNGFHSWKEAVRCLNTHEQTSTHKKAVELPINIPETTRDVGEMLSSSLAAEKTANRQVLLRISKSILFLAKQGIPLHGDGTEEDGNFMQLLKLRSIDHPNIDSFIQQKRDKYCSPQIQNEILKVMARHILRNIAKSIQQAKYFTIMADEVTDCSNKEQVAVCFRTVDENFEPQESFVGLHVVESIQADVLVEVLKDTMVRMNLSVKNCHGQCYDGAANMAGSRSGVATQIASEEPRAIFIHCNGHALNLAAGDIVKKNKLLQNTLDTTLEISKLLKFSPRRDAMFSALKSQISPETPGFRTLCPTRWTVRDFYRQHYFECLDLIINNIKDRFDQPGFSVLSNLEDILLKAAWNEDYATELEFVLSMYKDDFDASKLKTQLELLSISFSSFEKRPTLLEVRDHFAAMSSAQRSFV